MTSPALPPLAPDLELEDFNDELVALVGSQRRAVHLEAGPALVVDSCRRGDTLATLVDEVADATGSTPVEARAWVDRTLVELARVGVVVPDGRTDWSASTEGPDTGHG